MKPIAVLVEILVSGVPVTPQRPPQFEMEIKTIKVNSHWNRDHSGGNEALAGDGSIIVAHDNVRRRMSVDGFIASARPTSSIWGIAT
jgi:hypothetical protein